MEKYKKELIGIASKLDGMTDFHGKIKELTRTIVKCNDSYSTIELLKCISTIIDSSKYTKEIKQTANILKNYLIFYYGYGKISEICNQENKMNEDERSLSQLLKELDGLVGLKNVKEKVNNLIAYQKIQQLRRDNNLYSSKNTLHLAFTGNPGTGKTTVARIVGRIYKKLNLLSKGHFIEVSRTDLIAGYQGQTALKVKRVIEEAKGGVLFIDEAYSITENDHSDSYGRECLTELTKALEDYRDDLVVIVAGYTEPMNNFFRSNPGLKSRFNTFIEFEDYSPEELVKILKLMCKNNDYILEDRMEEKIYLYFEQQILLENENFSNGRLVRNLYDNLVMNHAKRLINYINLGPKELSIIKIEDFKFINKA